MNKAWVSWKYGWGETLKVTPNVELVAGKGESRGDKFYWQFGIKRSKPTFDTLQSAKDAAIRVATSELTEALAELLSDVPKEALNQ